MRKGKKKKSVRKSGDSLTEAAEISVGTASFDPRIKFEPSNSLES